MGFKVTLHFYIVVLQQFSEVPGTNLKPRLASQKRRRNRRHRSFRDAVMGFKVVPHPCCCTSKMQICSNSTALPRSGCDLVVYWCDILVQLRLIIPLDFLLQAM